MDKRTLIFSYMVAEAGVYRNSNSVGKILEEGNVLLDEEITFLAYSIVTSVWLGRHGTGPSCIQ